MLVWRVCAFDGNNGTTTLYRHTKLEIFTCNLGMQISDLAFARMKHSNGNDALPGPRYILQGYGNLVDIFGEGNGNGITSGDFKEIGERHLILD